MQQPELAASQFGATASAYLTSAVHAQGADLKELATALAQCLPVGAGKVLDLGCGAGHASFAAASVAAEVVAYDISPEMLSVVEAAARDKGLANIGTRQGAAETLPFADASFDAVISCMSAHHWRDVPAALRDMRRVLKPDGKVFLIDIAGSDDPLLNTWLQSVELLRDPSHVQDYSASGWRDLFTDAGFVASTSPIWRIDIEFESWVKRMRTAEVAVAAIRHLWALAPAEVREHYRVKHDGSFALEATMVTAAPVAAR